MLMDKLSELNTFLVRIKGTVVNREMLSLHGGSLEITLTVELENDIFFFSYFYC